MGLDLEGNRRRYFHERAELERRQLEGCPINFNDLSKEARGRLGREIEARARGGYEDLHTGRHVDIRGWLTDRVIRVLGRKDYLLDGWENAARTAPIRDLFTILEVAVDLFQQYRPRAGDLSELQSILADDFFGYRFRQVGHEVHVAPIENEHLHTVIVDRAFELTQEAAFASAQEDYSEAWKHYSRGELKQALTSAAKAVESAAKKAINLRAPDEDTKRKLGGLVETLSRLDLIPSEMRTISDAVVNIFKNSGCLRNKETVAHGSLEPGSPDASVALLGLRLSGSLMSFIIERSMQLR